MQIECANAECTYTGDQLEDYVEHVHSAHNSDLKFVDRRFDDRESLEVSAIAGVRFSLKISSCSFFFRIIYVAFKKTAHAR